MNRKTPLCNTKVVNFILNLILISVIISGCKKEDNNAQENTNDKPITEAELTATNSFTTRIWHIFTAEVKYFSASGNLDSTYTASPSGQNITFTVGTSGPVARAYAIYSYGGVIARFWPSVGEWVLSGDGRTLTVTQTSFFPEPGKPGGAYTVSYSSTTELPFPYHKALGLKRTETTSGGGKAEIAFLLGSNP